ncbi:hypothetical protein O7627_33615 [Solwaraspora sp. WMMD1047]|uniref:hypothetical protein n=1 Tax=Solwaraspora sp. WMMD1047 TaxID=3016102 RepID=UPI002417032A|nr:hypothetical protein [Solwaraspora sp. WMMD1047]MDG4834205.1 hypothetical protein [Solwaraspora sp. WMMD1047]
MASSVRNTKLFKERLAQLEEETSRLGVFFAPAEAADLLAERVTATANQLGVTERTALQTYTTPYNISLLAKVLAEQAATYREVMAEAEPVTITVQDAGRVVAALGMVCKLATGRIGNDPADAAGVLTDAADAIVGIGAELRTNEDNEPVTISGRTLVYSRTVLTRAIEGLTAAIWVCPCGEPHRPDAPPCALVQGLTADLNVVGGWLAAPNERPGEQR